MLGSARLISFFRPPALSLTLARSYSLSSPRTVLATTPSPANGSKIERALTHARHAERFYLSPFARKGGRSKVQRARLINHSDADSDARTFLYERRRRRADEHGLSAKVSSRTYYTFIRRISRKVHVRPSLPPPTPLDVRTGRRRCYK